jgi:hypothetical protein
METHSQREVQDMHEGKPLGRLGVIVAAGLFTLGLTAFAGQTVADSGGNGRGNGNGNDDAGNGNGNGNGGDSRDGNGAANRSADQVAICHVPPGNPDSDHTIEVGSPAVDAHVDNHGDSTGPCDATTSTSSTTTTTAPTSTSTTSTSTTTSSTSTTSSSSSSTSPTVAPDAVSDIGSEVTVGQAVSLSVLVNDVVGSPAATITQTDFDAVGACSGLSFDSLTGLLSGAPTDTGVCLFTYVIENSAGFDAAAVLVPVTA